MIVDSKNERDENPLRWPYQEMLEGFPMMSVVIDKSCNLLFANQRFVTLTERMREEIIGKNFLAQFVPEDEWQEIQSVLAGEKIAGEIYMTFMTRQRGSQPVRWHYMKTVDPVSNDKVLLCLGYFITGDERETSSLGYEFEKSNMLENGNVPIMLINNDGLIVKVNPEFEKATGWAADKVEGLLRIHDLVITENSTYQKILQLQNERSGLEAISFTAKYRVDKHEEKYGIFFAGFLPNMDLVRVVIVDITEQKMAEKTTLYNLERVKKMLGGTVKALSTVAERRDPYIADHQRRVSELAVAIAGRLGMPREAIDDLEIAALLHDIGKISVPMDILNKPGPLTSEEFALIKKHTSVGYEIVKSIPFNERVPTAIYQHHERLDGTGYPRGLKGDEITLEARILAVADVIDAMISHRPYRPALSLPIAVQEIKSNSGRKYDADIVNACLELLNSGFFINWQKGSGGTKVTSISG